MIFGIIEIWTSRFDEENLIWLHSTTQLLTYFVVHLNQFVRRILGGSLSVDFGLLIL